MSNRLANYFIAGALVSALALASPALAFRGGGGMGMGGGMHGMGGGMHGMGGGMGMLSMGIGGGMGMRPIGVGPRVGARGFTAMPMSRAAFAPGFSRTALAPRFSRAAFVPHHPFFFHHRFHRFNRFAFIGGPFFYGGYDYCWRRVWTAYGPQWINVCSDYGYGYF